MRLRKGDVPAKPETTSAPREVGRRVEAIVDQIKKQLEGMPGRTPVAYRFEVKRDAQGFIREIIARPLTN